MSDDRPGNSSGRRRAERWTRAEAVRDQWHQGLPPDTLAVLRADPELGTDKQIVLDLAYEEYCLQEQAGLAPPIEEFVEQFPTYRQSLRRLLAIHGLLEELPGIVPDVRWPAPGEVLAEYAIVRQLGRGGFAHVYLARETTAGNRAVVLKVSGDGLDEANTLGPLSHPHVMRVLGARRIGDLSVLVMPFLGTTTLEDVASAKPTDRTGLEAVCATDGEPEDPTVTESFPSPFPASDRLDLAIASIGQAVAEALAFLHRNGFAHQDLKPSNVLLTPSGFPVLLDFNLTTKDNEARSSVGGTVPYMAPEQLVAFCASGPSQVYDRSAADVYSLGVILYELLAGRHPFPMAAPGHKQGLPSREAVEARQQAPAPLVSLNPTVDAKLAAVVMTCLSVDPLKRPTASEVATQLRPIVAPAPPPTHRTTWVALCTLAFLAVPFWGYFARPEPVTTAQSEGGGADTPPPTQFEVGMALLNKGSFPAAGVEFQGAAQANDDGRAFAFAAYCYASSNLHDPSLSLYCAEQAIKWKFNDACVYTNRAFSLLNHNRLQEAKKDCDNALAIRSDLVEPRFIRAQVALLQYQGDPKKTPPGLEAIGDINFVRRNGPPAFDASFIAAQLYVARGDQVSLEEAVLAVEEALRRGMPLKTARNNRAFQSSLGKRPDFQKVVGAEYPLVNLIKVPTLIRPK